MSPSPLQDPLNAGGAAGACGEGRQAGVCLHISALPSPAGIGDIGDSALGFIDVLTSMKTPVWQFLPTGPAGYGDSPYQPLSAFAGNEMLIGMEPLVRAGLLQDRDLDPLRSLPLERVDYGALLPLKTALLLRAAESFREKAGADARQAYAAFCEAHGDAWLSDYVLFRLLKTRFQERPWTNWPGPFRFRDRAALEAVRRSEAAALERLQIVQFFFHVQWQQLRARAAERGVRLFGDMPIYIALDSADAWAGPELLQLDDDGLPVRVAGVPPDYFSADGQLWGNPLYDWAQHAASNYRWWSRRMDHAIGQFDLVRIDHFRGFEAYWSIPHGETTAREGRWEPGPGDRLFDALQAQLGPLPVVAEDLGLITPEVDALRKRHHMPGMTVLQFAVDDPAFVPGLIDADRVCFTGTHDNDTTAGWFEGGADDTRSEDEQLLSRRNALRHTRGTAATIHLDLVRLAFDSPAQLAIAPMQDLLGLGSEARFNVPGTTEGNWRWRVRRSQLSAEFRCGVARLVQASGRG